MDFSEEPVIQVDAREEFEQYSQEIRLTSPFDGEQTYIAGLYWQHAEIDFDESDSFAANLRAADELIPNNPLIRYLLSPKDVPTNISRPFTFKQEAETWSAFAQGTIHLCDDLCG